MKVLLVNGSSRPDGCTAVALKAVAEALEEQHITAEHFFIGNQPLSDCIACGKCGQLGRCVFDDCVNRLVEIAKGCNGFVFGSPVYYAHPSARLMAVMDRAFYSGGRHFQFKPAAAVLSARRAGQVAGMDVILKHFTLNCMPVVSATYWNHVFGAEPEEVLKDREGMMTMRNLGLNMAWLLKCIQAGKSTGIEAPHNEKLYTNFIR